VQVSKSHGNLGSIKLNFVFLKPSLSLEEPVEFSSSDEGHDEKESEFRHEEVLHANQELVLTLKHDVFLQLGVFDLVVFDQNVLPYNFYCVELLVKLELRQKHFAECSFAQHYHHLEIS